jgi:hypothetical protein
MSTAPSLDHVFVLCSKGAPEADALTRLGLREGSGNTHPGQGTACRRFFFPTVYLEFLWVHDPVEAQSPTTLPTRLFERWSSRQAGASPFGVVLRNAGPGRGEPPFPTWSYRPRYLPADLAIEVAVGTLLSEPALFYFGAPRRPEVLANEPTAHDLPLGAVASISIGGPGPWSAALREVEAAGLLSFPATEQHVLQVDFGFGGRDRTVDLRPELPLVLRF